jgi:hypothetical protein
LIDLAFFGAGALRQVSSCTSFLVDRFTTLHEDVFSVSSERSDAPDVIFRN